MFGIEANESNKSGVCEVKLLLDKFRSSKVYKDDKFEGKQFRLLDAKFKILS
jgi:hypothetical protein